MLSTARSASTSESTSGLPPSRAASTASSSRRSCKIAAARRRISIRRAGLSQASRSRNRPVGRGQGPLRARAVHLLDGGDRRAIEGGATSPISDGRRAGTIKGKCSDMSLAPLNGVGSVNAREPHRPGEPFWLGLARMAHSSPFILYTGHTNLLSRSVSFMFSE